MHTKRLAKSINICVVTGSRSEYGLMRWLMADLSADQDFELKIVVTASHLSIVYGETFRVIENDGFKIDEMIHSTIDPSDIVSIANSVGEITAGMAKYFQRSRPDIVLVMGDRYELLAISNACLLMGIPIGHISGGEITEGAIDDQIRHSLTKISHLHFVANKTYADRVEQMGEEKWRICISGEPGLDNLNRLPLFSKEELEKELNLDLSIPTALVTFHPETKNVELLDEQIDQLMKALQNNKLQYILTYPAADFGSLRIIESLIQFQKSHLESSVIYKNLGQKRYLSVLRYAHLMIGNSSSGIVETPSFNLPVVNIGVRQKGRIRAKNVMDVKICEKAISRAIKWALNYDRNKECLNPYGDGNSSIRVISFIKRLFTTRDEKTILNKHFIDINKKPEQKFQMGGPFELNLNILNRPLNLNIEDYFKLNKNDLFLKSGRSALKIILQHNDLNKKEMLIPDYLCGEVIYPIINQLNICYHFYNIDDELKIDENSLMKKLDNNNIKSILLIDYFGMVDHNPLMQKIESVRKDITIILDCAQALYKPVYYDKHSQLADYLFVSFRKYLEVPEGAFIRSKRPLNWDLLKNDITNNKQAFYHTVASVLKYNYLHGKYCSEYEYLEENMFLNYFEKSKKHLTYEYMPVEEFTNDLIQRLPLDKYSSIRISNYEYLLNSFNNISKMKIIFPNLGENAVPLAFPVLIMEQKRDDLREYLISKKIFCPVHWPLIQEIESNIGERARKISRDILSFPIDQRYNHQDLDLLICLVQKFWKNN